MPEHRQCLQGICRLCGENGRLPITKEKLSVNIVSALGISVDDDDEDVHPPYVCKGCEGKLKRWWVLVKHRKMKAPCYITPVTFERKSCDECAGKPEKELSMAEVEVEAKRVGLVTWQGPDCLLVMKMSVLTCRPVAYLNIFPNWSWDLVISGVPIVREDEVWLEFSLSLSKEDAFRMLEIISSKFVCEGNRDFLTLIEAEKGSNGQLPISVTHQDTCIEGNIRHKKCRLLIQKKGRCSVCQVYRSDLMAKHSKNKSKANQVICVSSSLPNKHMTKKQLKDKTSLLQSERRCLKRRVNILEDKVSDMLQRECVDLSTQQDQALQAAVISSTNEMESIFQPNSPAPLLWAQQRESALKGKQMRWHPTIIRWCIALQSKSSAAYNLLRQTKFLRLPHPSTLHPYTHFADPVTGFSPAMLERVVADNNISSCQEHEKNVSILFDEMKIKAGLGFSVRSGKVIGFTDVGSIANEIANFERRCRGEKQSPASHVMVVMVRGIFSNLHAAVAYYPTTGATSDQLCSILWEAIFFLEVAGFKVRALVSDGASSNRKFYRLHDEGHHTEDEVRHTEDEVHVPNHYCTHPYDQTRKVFFICDVPHLIKTTRNNLENSGYHNKTKTLMFNKEAVSWVQLLKLYEWDVGVKRQSPGLRRLPKLTHEHFHLTPSLRMRVYLAAQVLSSSVANAVEAQKQPGTGSLVKFIRMFDQFFDCLNVSNTYKGTRLRKPALEPYRSTDDWRFEWLTKDFLGFLKTWNDEAESQDLEQAAKLKMCLSRETQEGLRITVHSFVAMAKVLLELPGVTHLLSEKFSQDPIEEYFSKQRGSGGCNDNPSVEQFGHNMLAIQVASTCIRASKRGNCRLEGRPEELPLDNTPLPRRK